MHILVQGNAYAFTGLSEFINMDYFEKFWDPND